MRLLENKLCVITGGNAGIGKAIAKRFAEQGARLALLATNSERGAKVVEEIGAERAKFYKVDISKQQEVEAVLLAVQQEMGVIDILVNNAGIVRDHLLMKMPVEDWDAVLATNLDAIYHTCHALIRSFLKARRGRIINLTSVVGLTGNAGQTNYAAAKSGVIGFSKSLAQEVASRGITVNCIAPGFIDTEMTASLTEEQKKAILAKVPMGRLGSPEEIAEAALFLASDYASYITGQVLTVDGGMVM